MAKRLIQIIKDINVLDTYRYNMIYLGKSISKETLEDSKKNVRIFKERLYKTIYHDYVDQFPKILLKDPTKT
jgi:hypothetical protein